MIPTVVNLAVGVFLIFMSSHIPASVASGFLGMSRRTEILALGIFFIVGPQLFSLFLALNLRRGRIRETRLLQNGTPAVALLTSVELTGTTINNTPQYRFALEVTVPGRTPFKAEMKECVSVLYSHNLQPGNVFRAMTDPETGALAADFSLTLDPEEE